MIISYSVVLKKRSNEIRSNEIRIRQELPVFQISQENVFFLKNAF